MDKPTSTTTDAESFSTPPLSVVMPAYNEEEAITQAVQDVQEYILNHILGAELIVVNDGSRDRTAAILGGIKAKDDRVRIINQANSGHGEALRTGLEAARGEYAFLVDSDRQIPLDRFAEHWRVVQGHDALFGSRRRRHDPLPRLALTRVVRYTICLLFGVSLHDANAPYKIIRNSAWKRASPLIPPGTLAPSLFLAVIMRRRGESIVETEVTHRSRETGAVTLRYWKLLKFCACGFRQLLTLRSDLKRSREVIVKQVALPHDRFHL